MDEFHVYELVRHLRQTIKHVDAGTKTVHRYSVPWTRPDESVYTANRLTCGSAFFAASTPVFSTLTQTTERAKLVAIGRSCGMRATRPSNPASLSQDFSCLPRVSGQDTAVVVSVRPPVCTRDFEPADLFHLD